MKTVRVMGPSELRPDWLWPDDDELTRMDSPAWHDPETGDQRAPEPFVELFAPEPDGRADATDPVLMIGYDGATSAPLAESTAERAARTVRWPIERLVLTEKVYDQLAGLAPIAGRVAAGLTVEHARYSYRQRLTADAQAARAEFAERLAEAFLDWPVLEVHDIASAYSRDTLKTMVTADTSDEELSALAEQLRARITPARPDNYVVLAWAVERLADLRDQARVAVRDRLAIVAGLASGDRRERDELLRRIAAWDDSADTYRSLGQLVGMSHTAVRKIVKQVTEDRDTALDHLDTVVTSLRQAWDPPHLPVAVDDQDDFYDEPTDAELEDQERDDLWRRRNHLRHNTCAACGKPSRRIVRRWQIDKAGIAADPDDPHRNNQGNVCDLSSSPNYSGQPTWGVCGTSCARQVIETDRAKPNGGIRVAGNDEFFYAIESFRYLPHDSELPDVLIALRRNLELIDYARDELTRTLAVGDTAGAALHLASLRRDVARTAATLADLTTYTPPVRTFHRGDPEPADVGQVRHGDTIYTNWARRIDFDFPWRPERPEHWEAPDHTRHTWDELTALGELVEIPREHIDLRGREDHE